MGHLARHFEKAFPAVVGQHPSDAAFVEARFQHDVDAKDQDQEQRGNPADQAADHTGQLTDPAQCLLRDAGHRIGVDGKALCFEPVYDANALLFDDGGELRGLIGKLGSREEGHPRGKERAQNQHDCYARTAVERDHFTQKPRTAIDDRGKDQPAENHQQRLRHVDRRTDKHDDERPDQRLARLEP